MTTNAATIAITCLLALQITVPSVRTARNGTSVGGPKLAPSERYRRLIPYMTFYLQGDPGQSYNRNNQENHVNEQRFQQYHQETSFTPAGQFNQPSYIQPYTTIPQGYYQAQNPSSLTRTVAQSYLAKNRQQPGRLSYTVSPPQTATAYLTTPRYISGFKPMDPNAVTITQSQELPVRQQEPLRQPEPLRHQEAVRLDAPIRHQENSYRQELPVRQQEIPVPVRIHEVPKVPQVARPQEIPVRVGGIPVHSVTINPPDYLRSSTPRPYTPVHYVTTYKPNLYSTPAKPAFDYDYEDGSDASYNLLNGYDLSKALPQRITSDNLESSIKTLSKLLSMLQKANTYSPTTKKYTKPKLKPIKVRPTKPQYLDYDDEGSTPGRAGVDYPALDRIPETSFSCKEQRYKGFFGDPETNCQVWHYCDLNGGQASFLCPNGTIFSQVALTCDWWFNVKCASTAQLYVLNERLYKYIIPQKPSFPEDYAGPLVDRYLAEKFKELEEEKVRNATLKATTEDSEESTTTGSEEDEDEHPAYETNQAKRSISELSARMDDH